MILTQRNYFSRKANREYMSCSQFKAFEKCENAALAEIKGKYKREPTTALLVGSYVDSYFEGTLPAFKKKNPSIFTKKGELKADFVQAEEIIKRIERDKLFMNYLSGEKQVIMTGVICGVPIKIKIDVLHSDKIVDLKTTKDFESVFVAEKGLLPWWAYWKYPLQGAVYQEIVFQNTGHRLPFYLAAATKEKAIDIDIIRIEQDELDFAFEEFKANAERYDAIKKGIVEPERCNNCEYCKISKVLTEPTSSNDFYFL